MKNRRRLLVAIGASTLAAPLGSFAQQKIKIWRIGLLHSESLARTGDRVDAFRAGLRELGYEEGKNLVIEFRWAEGKNDRLPELATELVRLKVDVLVTHGTLPLRAAMISTTTIPIVTASSGDIVAVLFNADSPSQLPSLQAMETTARSSKVTLHKFPVRGPQEFDSAFTAMVKKRVGAAAITDDPMFVGNPGVIAELAVKHRLPLIGPSGVAVAGGLTSYGVTLPAMFHRAAYFVDKIFKGAKPGDMPIEQATQFEMIVNLKAAKALGIKIPASIMVRATKVIG